MLSHLSRHYIKKVCYKSSFFEMITLIETLPGFLTSPELFYVRNHGPVPEVRDEDIPDWELSIEG